MKVGRNEESNDQTRDGSRMQRNEESMSEEEDKFGVLCIGRRYKRLKNGAEKGESCIEYETREPYALIYII
jgi:hypothetical protein